MEENNSELPHGNIEKPSDKDIIYKDFSKSLESIVNKSTDDFEKQLSFISAGALALSLTFMDKLVVNLNQSSCRWLLVAGWTLLAFTLILNLISHLVSAHLHNKTLKEIQENDDSYYEKAYKRNNRISFINYISIITLVLGLFSIIIFSSLNLYNVKAKSTNRKATASTK